MVEEQPRVRQTLCDREHCLVQQAAVDRQQVLPVVHSVRHRVRASCERQSHLVSAHCAFEAKRSGGGGPGRAGHAKNENVKELRSSQDQVNSIKVLISKQIEPSYLSLKHCRIGSFDLHLSVHNAAGLHLTCSRKLWPAEVS